METVRSTAIQEAENNSVISVTLHRLHGVKESECLASGAWSGPFPVCENVTCPYPVIPRLGRLDFFQPREGNVSIYRDMVRYTCDLSYALIGNEMATCRANGTWSHVPECRNVKCQRPAEILNGYMSFAPYRKYNYKEEVMYGCNLPYALVGPRSSYWTKMEIGPRSRAVRVRSAVALWHRRHHTALTLRCHHDYSSVPRAHAKGQRPAQRAEDARGRDLPAADPTWRRYHLLLQKQDGEVRLQRAESGATMASSPYPPATKNPDSSTYSLVTPQR
ncbi:unnamed protein product [Ranitomeya imitator]|uniref:Sushi domain-containing protein n=1 Tax=Ranitomeya imitator TaxID=111125 RepID=A0ABN9KQ39_9NEOB|nr:unnamed protein product [Ranitomeya imitator]